MGFTMKQKVALSKLHSKIPQRANGENVSWGKMLLPGGIDLDYEFNLTTGQVAKLLGVAPRTVSKWCDGKLLPSFRLPRLNMNHHMRQPKNNEAQPVEPSNGFGKDRRVKLRDLIRFLQDNNLPIPPAFRPFVQATEVLIYGLDSAWYPIITETLHEVEYHEYTTAIEVGFYLGTLTVGQLGKAVIGDAEGMTTAVTLCNLILTKQPKASVTLIGDLSNKPLLATLDTKIITHESCNLTPETITKGM